MRLKNQRFFLWLNQIIFPFFYLRHQGKVETVVNMDEGASFNVRVNTSDILVIWEIWRAKIYDDPRFPIKEDDIVVDIGAHIGGFSIRAAKLAHFGRVYAYEASSKNYDLLKRNSQLCRVNNITSYNKAVSDTRGELKFYQPGHNGALGSLIQDTDSPMEIVESVTLPDIISENNIDTIDLLKIDAEGAEYNILLNSPDTALAKVRRIILEYHEFDNDPRDHKDIVKLLEAHRFKVVVEAGIFPQKFLFGTGIIKAWRE